MVLLSRNNSCRTFTSAKKILTMYNRTPRWHHRLCLSGWTRPFVSGVLNDMWVSEFIQSRDGWKYGRGVMVCWHDTGETNVMLGRATLSTTNPKWTWLGLKRGLRGEQPECNSLSHGTATFPYQTKFTQTHIFVVLCRLHTTIEKRRLYFPSRLFRLFGDKVFFSWIRH